MSIVLDAKAFSGKLDLEFRKAEVECNELKEWFGSEYYTDKDGVEQNLVLVVRNLVDTEIYEYNDIRSQETQDLISGLEDGMAGLDGSQVAENVRKMLGVYKTREETSEEFQGALVSISGEIKPHLKQKRYLVRIGTLEPKMPEDFINKISRHKWVVFERLANKILELTGLGSQKKKR